MSLSPARIGLIPAVAWLLCVVGVDVAGVDACPFCTAESQTLTEEMASADVVTLAHLAPPKSPETPVVDPETGTARFVVDEVLRGEGAKPGDPLSAVFFGDPDMKGVYLVRGIGAPPDWAIPLALSPVAVDYVKRLGTLPESGADRLDFMQEFLEHDDPLLAQDSYDEFARAPYAELKDLAPRMDRARLWELIRNPTVSPSRRRLFFMMLGVCGGPEDIAPLEELLTSDSRVLTPTADALASVALAAGGPLGAVVVGEAVRLDQRREKLGLDAMVASYLTLRGAEGMDLIDRRFLARPGVDYSHVYSTLMAVRFLAEEETTIVPRERLLVSARLLLDNPDFADQVIPDLARWEDWSVLDRLVELYRSSGREDAPKYVREPIVTYLDVAAEQGGELAERANAALEALEPIDPEAFRRARSLRAFGFLAAARPAASPAGATPATDGATPEADAQPPLADEDTPSEGVPGDADPPDAESSAIPDPTTFEPAAEQPAAPAEPAAPGAAPPADVVPPGRPAAVRPGQPPVGTPGPLVLLGAPVLGLIVSFGVLWVTLRGGSA